MVMMRQKTSHSEPKNTETKEEYLKRIYTTPQHPASFSGPEKLRQVTQKEGLFNISRSDIRKFLETQDTYTVNRSVRRRFKRNKVIAHGVNDQFDIDLCDVSRLARFNSNVRFLLVAVDVFSRFALVRPLKNKTAASVESALECIFKGDHVVRRVRSDRGAEFTNARIKQLFDKKGIKHFYASAPLKCQIVERLNQTLKQLIYRYLYEHNTYKYLDVLEEIVYGYNSRPHRSLFGLSPIEVNSKNQASLWNRMYVNTHTNHIKRRSGKSAETPYKFSIGDYVRISYAKKTFERAYNAKFTLEVFQVSARFRRNGIPVYMLKDLQGDAIEGGTFYESEIQRVNKAKGGEGLWRIDRVLRSRGKEVLVRWSGFPPKFDSWILKSSMKKGKTK